MPGLSLIFAIAVLGLSGRATDASILFLGGIAPFEIINLVVAPLTIVALSIMYVFMSYHLWDIDKMSL